MKIGPINLMPYINNYESKSQSEHKGKLQQIFDKNDIIKRKEEKAMINAYINMPCRVNYIESRLGKSPFA